MIDRLIARAEAVAEGDELPAAHSVRGAGLFIGVELGRDFSLRALREAYDAVFVGIGLTLVKKIVTMYGGDVWVESEVNKGSSFFFTLPKTI